MRKIILILLVLCILPSVFATVVLNMTFDNTTGIYNSTFAQDMSSGSHNSSLVNATYNNLNGKLGGYYNFPVSSLIQIPDFNETAADKNITVSIWVNCSSSYSFASGITRTIIAHYNVTSNNRGWALEFNNQSNNMSYRVILTSDGATPGASNAKAYNSSMQVCDNTWHNLGFTFGDNGLNLYFDGTNDTTIVKSFDAGITSIKNSADNIFLGFKHTNNYMVGDLDEVLIYNETKNTTQMMDIYNTYTTSGVVNEDGLAFNKSFDSGGYQSITRLAQYYYELNLTKDNCEVNNGQEYLWFYFNVSNTSGKNLSFIIRNYNASKTDSNYRQTAFYPVWSCDNITWNRLGSGNTTQGYGWSNYTFRINTSCQSFRVAAYYPYEYSRTVDLFNQYNQSPYNAYSNLTILGTSVQGRNIYKFEITNRSISDSNKKTIYIVARQHPAETAGDYQVKGLIDYLMNSTDSNSALLRTRFKYIIVPTLNPDGVYNGYSRGGINNYDFNRKWAGSVSQEVNLVKADMLVVNATSPINVIYDVHGNNGGGTQNNYVETFTSAIGTSLYNEQTGIFNNLSALSLYDTQSQSAPSAGSGVLKQWGYNTYKVISWTLEDAMYNSSHNDNMWLSQGKNISLALNSYYYTSDVPPTIGFNSNTTSSGNTTINYIYVSTYPEAYPWNATYITLYNSSGLVSNVSANSTNFTGLGVGIYYFNATVKDGSGDTNKTETRIVQINAVVAKTIYVSNIGDDDNDGLSDSTPIKTIAKLNSIYLNAGDTVKFRKGDVWLLPEDSYIAEQSGNTTHNVTYTSYGIGTKPRIYGGYNLTLQTDFVESGDSNIWVTESTYSTECTVILSGTSPARYVLNYADLDSQGEYMYNSSTDKIYIYSSSNPITTYGQIILAVEVNILSLNNTHNVFISDLELSYGGRHGIECTNCRDVTISNNTVRYVGGTLQTGTTRYGNAIQLWCNNSYVNLYNNTIDYVYDAGITPQCSDGYVGNISNIIIQGNIVTNAYYPLEIFSHGSNRIDNVSVNHNTFYNLRNAHYGNTRSYDMVRLSTANSSNISIINNIIGNNSVYRLIEKAIAINVSSNYNLYYLSNGSYMFTWNGSNYASISSLNTASGQESNGIEADPLFIPGTYQPYSNSPACNNASDGGDIGAVECSATSLTTDNLCFQTGSTDRALYFLIIVVVAGAVYMALASMTSIDVAFIITFVIGTLILVITFANTLLATC